MRHSNKLRGFAREFESLDLEVFVKDARARASSMTCGCDRQKACELRRLADLAESLHDAESEFRTSFGSTA